VERLAVELTFQTAGSGFFPVFFRFVILNRRHRRVRFSIMRSSPESLVASLPIGTLLGTPVRLSGLVLVTAFAAGWQLWDPVAAVLLLTGLICALLVQNVVWLAASRRAGIYPGSLLLWPGGRVCSEPPFPQDLPAHSRSSLYALGASLLSCMVLLALLRQQDLFSADLLLPLTLPSSAPTDTFATRCLRLGFVVHWNLLLASLFPARPQDLGQILYVFLCRRLPHLKARTISARLGMFCSGVCVLSGFVFGHSSLTAFAAFLTLLQYEELRRVHEATLMERAEQRFRELAQLLDFEETDDSEEDDTPDPDDPAGILFNNSFHFHSESEGWVTLTTRDEESRPTRDDRDEAELDRILTKLHAHGQQSLSATELGILNRLSQRFRQRKVRR